MLRNRSKVVKIKLKKANEDYIRLKQIRNSQEKSSKNLAENASQESEGTAKEN